MMISMNDETEKPWRHRAEVFIIKDGKIVVGITPGKYIAIPGGGVDSNESLLKAARRECLEEIGVSIKNMKIIHPPFKIKYSDKSSYSDKHTMWRDKWAGVVFHTFQADFDSYDKSLWGKEQDSYTSEVLSINHIQSNMKTQARKNKKLQDHYNYEKALYVIKILDIIKKDLRQ